MKNHMNCGCLGLTSCLSALTLCLFFTSPAALGGPIISVSDKNISYVNLPPETFLSNGVTKTRQVFDGQTNPAIELVDRYGRRSLFLCTNNALGSNVVPSYKLPTDRSKEPWPEYTNKASYAINACASWKMYNGNADMSNLLEGYAFVYDGFVENNYLHSGMAIDRIPINYSSANCKAQMITDMDFGTIKLGMTDSTIPAQATLTIECDKHSNITISVNNGEDLESTEGSRITFNYEPSITVDGSIPLSLPIEGTLRLAPSRPGIYKWYVPILVSYE